MQAPFSGIGSPPWRRVGVVWVCAAFAALAGVVRVCAALAALENILNSASPLPEYEFEDLFYHTNPEGRVVGGTQAAEGSVPYMVAMSQGLLIRSFLCGGSIITSRTVLTAAHCIDAVFSFGSLSNSIRVTVGTNRWNSGGQTYTLERNVTHPNYVSSTIKNDIGILITSTNIAFSNSVLPVQIGYDFVGGGVAGRVAGWGRIRAGGALAAVLQELVLDTLDGERCEADLIAAAAALNVRGVPPVESHIEVCTFHSVNHGTCNGDSGSALVRTDNGHQFGIVSWGLPCAVGAPDMFVRVSAYRDWLCEMSFEQFK